MRCRPRAGRWFRPPRHPLAPPGVLAVLVAPVAVWALNHAAPLRLPFVGDDYFYLDEIRNAAFAGLGTPANLASRHSRPWSREFHFGILERVFGLESGLFRVANLTLCLAIAALCFTFVHRFAGARTAASATAGMADLGRPAGMGQRSTGPLADALRPDPPACLH